MVHSDAPEDRAMVPGKQLIQVVAPYEFPYDPTEQFRHTVERAPLLYKPGLHAAHVDASAAAINEENEPATQL